MGVRSVRRIALVALLPFLLAACAEKHVKTYAGSALPAEQIAVIEADDNRKTNPGWCNARLFASVTQVDGTELGKTISVDIAPGSHDVVVGYYYQSALHGTWWSFERRFTVTVQAHHRYKVHVRWNPCPGWFAFSWDLETLESWIYDVASGEIVSKLHPKY
jgi:hypothetical protein